jgi:hypothetical protein
MADIKGPGCIWRTWSAAPGGSCEDLSGWLGHPGGRSSLQELFRREDAAFQSAQPGLSSPQAPWARQLHADPFQKSCKIVADKNWGDYYQFTYTNFPEGTVVPTFSMNLSAEDSAALDQGR